MASASQYRYLAPMRTLRVDDALLIGQAGTASTPRAIIKVTPNALSFGSVEAGQASVPQGIRLTNIGTLAGVLSAASVGSPYSVGPGCDGVTLPALGTCQTSIVFSPTAVAATVPGSFSMAYSDGIGNMVQTQVLLNGAGVVPVTVYAPALSFMLSQQGFGDVAIGTSVSKTYILNNFGNAVAPLEFSATPTGVTSSKTCLATLGIGAQCTITLTYAPTDATSVAGSITVSSGASLAALSYSGTGVAHPSFSLSTASIAFGALDTGTTAQRSLVVLNSGNVPLATPVITASGAAYNTSHNCAATLGVGDSCLVTLTFAPTQPQAYFGNISVEFAGVAAQTATLNGAGQQAVISADVTTQAFGDVNLLSSSAKTFTLTNSGNITANLGYSTVATPVTQGGTCGATLGAGASCTVVLTYAPVAATATNGSLTVSGASTSVTLSYSGTGVAAPSFSLSSTNVAFGNLAANATAQQSIQISNTGNVGIAAPVVGVSGTGMSQTNTCSAALAVGTNCAVTLTFAPTIAQTYSGTLSVAVSGLGTQTASAVGTGQSAVLSVDSASQAFGNVSIGSSMAKTFTLTNNGNIPATLAIDSVAAPVVKAGTCGSALGVGASCTVVLTYSPLDTAPVSGTVTVSAINTALSLSYSGAGVAYPGFSLSGTSLAFANVAVNAAAQQSITVYNAGNVPLNTPVITESGTGYSASHNCPASLAVGASCQVAVTFAPTAPQSYSGTLSVNWAGVSAQAATLSGTGQAAVLSADMTTQAFGSVSILSSTAKTFTLTNSGNVTATLGYSAVSAPVMQEGTCGATLGAGASCTVVLTYAPTSTVVTSGALTVSATNTSVTLNYSGTGVANPSFSLSSTTVAFGSQATGANLQLSVIVTNTGNVPLTTATIGTAGTGFATSHNCAASLAVSGTCTVTVTFNPALPQVYSGSLSVAYSNAIAQTSTLSGTGTQALLVASPSTQAFGSVKLGTSTSQTFTVTNNGNLSASLGYSALAAYVTRGGTCGATLTATSSCTVILTYAPMTLASVSSALTVSALSTSVNLGYTGSGINLGIVTLGSTRTWADGTVATSCRAYRNGATGYAYSGVTGDGTYRIDADGAGATPSVDVWCDMTSDGGIGYSELSQSSGNQYAAGMESSCLASGLELFVPRTSAHFSAALVHFGVSNFQLMGIYPHYQGATCIATAMNASTCATWGPTRGGSWYISNLATVTEPNGDNDTNGSMIYQYDSTGSVSWYNDIFNTNGGGYSAATWTCSSREE